MLELFANPLGYLVVAGLFWFVWLCGYLVWCGLCRLDDWFALRTLRNR